MIGKVNVVKGYFRIVRYLLGVPWATSGVLDKEPLVRRSRFFREWVRGVCALYSFLTGNKIKYRLKSLHQHYLC